MNLHESIVVEIAHLVDSYGVVETVSPSTVALDLQKHYAPGMIPPEIAYASLEHFKQMARRFLRGRFEDGEASEAYEGELFSGHLQQRYPIPHKRDEEPLYKRRDLLSEYERAWNVSSLRKAGEARLMHADALEAEGRRSVA